MGRIGVVCVLAAIALGACGERAALPRACVEATSADVLRALSSAGGPGRVALEDGTPLSRCVARAVDDSQLQALGATLTSAGATLAQRMDASAEAALQLGFLIGATARGADATAGLQAELAARVAGLAQAGDGGHRQALLRGRELGRREG